MSKKNKEKTTGQEFKNALELIFKYKVNMGKKEEYTTIPKIREAYKKKGVTEAMFKEQLPKILPEVSKNDVEMLAQRIFRPTEKDLEREAINYPSSSSSY